MKKQKDLSSVTAAEFSYLVEKIEVIEDQIADLINFVDDFVTRIE